MNGYDGSSQTLPFSGRRPPAFKLKGFDSEGRLRSSGEVGLEVDIQPVRRKHLFLPESSPRLE